MNRNKRNCLLFNDTFNDKIKASPADNNDWEEVCQSRLICLVVLIIYMHIICVHIGNFLLHGICNFYSELCTNYDI